MVTKSINEAKAGIMNLAANATAKPQGNKDGDSFQRIFDKQTGSDTQKTERSAKEPGQHLKKNASVRADKVRETAKRVTDSTEMDNEELAKMNELAENAGAEIMSMLSEMFGIPMEELEGLMQEMGITAQDLLSDATLNGFVMEIGGAEDVTELLTNGELYGKLQELMEAKSELVEEAAGEFELSPKEFLEHIQEQPKGNEDSDLQGIAVTENSVEADQTVNVQSGRESQGKQEERRDESHGDGGSGNLVLQQIIQDNAEISLDAVQENVPRTEGADTEMIMRQILDHMKVQLKPDITSLEMQLHPASLGNLQVQLTSREGMVTAQFFAQNEAVKAALETQMIQLQESFEEQGIKVEAIEVAVQTRSFEQNLDEQGRGRQEQQAPKTRPVRRLQIGEPLTQEQLDELTKDDRLAVEMMQAGGGSVDYTA